VKHSVALVTSVIPASWQVWPVDKSVYSSREVVLEADDVESRSLSEVAVDELTVLNVVVLAVVVLTVMLAVEREVVVLVAIPLQTKL